MSTYDWLTLKPGFDKHVHVHVQGHVTGTARVHSGSPSWLRIYLHHHKMGPAQGTTAWVHPGSCAEARISLMHETSQQFHVNAKRPLGLARRLEREAQTCKRDMKSRRHHSETLPGASFLNYCLFLCPRGWGIDLQERKKLQIPRDVRGGGGAWLQVNHV